MAHVSRHDFDAHPARDARRALAQRAAHDLLRGLEARPAAPADERDTELMRSLDTLLAQAIRAARHTSGSVRAYASLIEDGYESASNAAAWAARIAHAAVDLDEFASRIGALRMCETERVTEVRPGDVLSRVAARCSALGACTIEVVDRTTESFRHRSEWMARTLFHTIRNAVEATPRGGIVRVRADQIRLEGTRAVHVRVTDAGKGIDPDLDPDAIWKPFITTKSNHAGLGLAYVSACASLLGIVNGVRSDASGTTVHSIIFEQGELTW